MFHDFSGLPYTLNNYFVGKYKIFTKFKTKQCFQTHNNMNSYTMYSLTGHKLI